MAQVKTKSITKIEERMEGISEDSVRYEVLNNAKSFKTSWIGLGQALYSVWKDKLYRDWGFSDFDAYTKKEIGIRKQTALKLLKSYSFLEKEDPRYLQRDFNEKAPAASMPTYESVDVLRLANKKKGVDNDDYTRLRRKVLESGSDAREVKKDLTAIIKQREELLPEEAWQKKRDAQIKRVISLLRSLKVEIKVSKTLPGQLLKDIDKLITKLETAI